MRTITVSEKYLYTILIKLFNCNFINYSVDGIEIGYRYLRYYIRGIEITIMMPVM